jgi:hypothetical protein
MAHNVSYDDAIFTQFAVLVPEKVELISSDLITTDSSSVNVETDNKGSFLR